MECPGIFFIFIPGITIGKPEECCRRKAVLIFCLGLCDYKDPRAKFPDLKWGACERYRTAISSCQL